jgi:hypothetical protein
MIPKIKKVIRKRPDKIYQRRDARFDFLKNWGIIRKWAIHNYAIKSQADIDMLMFLYTEQLFTRAKFQEYAKFMSWDRARFDKLLRDGFISKWRERKKGEFDVYEVSFKGKKMIASIYRKLLGLEPIPESPRRNIVFRPNATFAQKTLAIAIKRINKEARECKQHPSLEE